jgi:hypothetical protein
VAAARVPICLILFDSTILNESYRPEVRLENRPNEINKTIRDRKAVVEIKVDV